MRWNYVRKSLNALKCAQNLKRRWKFKISRHIKRTSYIISAHFEYTSCKSFSTFFQRIFFTKFQRKFSISVEKCQRFWESVKTIKIQRIFYKVSAQIQHIRRKSSAFLRKRKTIKISAHFLQTFCANSAHL